MPDNIIQPVPEAAEAVVPYVVSAPSVQGGQDLHVSPLEADLQAIDPVIERTVDLQAASSESEISGDLQAAGPVPNYLQVPASALQGSAAVGLQISASFGGLRPYPNTSTLWTGYFKALPDELPRMKALLTGFRMPYHPAARFADYLACVISGDLRGGPIAGVGMHLMALDGLRALTDDEILSRMIYLDLTVRLFRRNYVSTKAARGKEAAVAQEKLQELEAEKEMYESSKAVYHDELERLEDERARFRYDLELFAGARAKFDHDLLRFGSALDLGTTIEELQMNQDRLIERLKAVLESSLIDSTAQLELVAKMGLSGGTAQWLHRSQDLLRQSIGLPNSASANQVRFVEQENRHKAAMNKLEEEKENLRLQVEYLTNKLRESQIQNTDERSS